MQSASYCVPMTSEEWESSSDAPQMLATLHAEQPLFLRTQVPQIHRFLIACCWKHQNLIPQDGLRQGLRGAESWLAGKISDTELNRLDWYAEADAFGIEYAKSPEEIVELKSLIEGIDELRQLPFKVARQKLLDAAYFAEGSMIYPLIDRLPWVESLLTSQFLCADLLRKHITPNFDE